MSELPDDLDARLRGLSAPGPHTLSGPAAARRRGDQRSRRHRAVLAGAGVVVVAAVAVATGITSGAGGIDRIRTPDVADEPAPTPTLQPGPSAAPPPSTAPAPGSDTEPADPGPSGVPVQDLLIDEAAAGRAEPGSWTPAQPDQPPLLDPCAGGTDYPRDADRTDTASTALQTLREAGGTSVQQTLARYTTPAAAADAAAGYERAVRGCPGGSPVGAGGSPEVEYEVVSSIRDAGVTTVVVRASQGVIYASYLAVQQRGDLVSVLSVAYGEDGDPGVEAIEPYLGEVTAAL